MSKPVLIACECSQVESKAFRELGVECYSCDIQPCYGGHPEWHIQADAIETLYSRDWGLVIAHPPCTYMCVLSAVHLVKDGRIDTEREKKMRAAVEFFYWFYDYEGSPIAIENPRPMARCGLPPKSQVICPSDFGHPYTKRTYLWLKDLPQLLPTHCHNINARSYVYHTHAGNRRSRSFEGIAAAMAAQWSKYIL